MNWGIAQAKQRFSELMQAAITEPQPIYKRDQLIAFVVEASLFREFLDWRRQKYQMSVAEAFEGIREMAKAEDFSLEAPARKDRANPFLDDDYVSV
ncbi:MAG: prevent-host-death protein [Cyanobacteria bacterium P01_G01_bin.54]